MVKARLYVTSLGVHRVSINGTPVSDELLNPGWSSYRHRLLAATYDVTSQLRAGPNVIAGVLGDGWYRGRLGWDPTNDRCRYGTDLGLIAQLELELADGSSQLVATDGSWRVTTGEIRSADLYDGAVIDFRECREGWELPGYDDEAWLPVKVVSFDASLIQPRISPPVRPVDVMPVALTEKSDGHVRLVGNQNIAGFVRLTVRGKAGDLVTVRHAEVLEPDGSLHVTALRSAKATDSYTLADDEIIVLEPAFTFHGFQYADVETDAEILGAEFVAISSDTPRRGRFECSDQSLNRFHENVVWSQRGQLRVSSHGLSPAGRAPRVDRRRPGIRHDCVHAVRCAVVLGELADRPRPRSGRGIGSVDRRARRRPRRGGAVRAGGMGRRGHASFPGRSMRRMATFRCYGVNSPA